MFASEGFSEYLYGIGRLRTPFYYSSWILNLIVKVFTRFKYTNHMKLLYTARSLEERTKETTHFIIGAVVVTRRLMNLIWKKKANIIKRS